MTLYGLRILQAEAGDPDQASVPVPRENELQTPLESSTESHLDVQLESEVIDERQSKVEVTDKLAGEFESKRNRRAPVWMRDYVTE
uniref:Uncharacterized protein n=1 Tax=Magallana gigas TaxID=29159 RepID=A0A8W8P7B4_MAGGI